MSKVCLMVSTEKGLFLLDADSSHEHWEVLDNTHVRCEISELEICMILTEHSGSTRIKEQCPV